MTAAFLIYAACAGWLGDRLLSRVTPRIVTPAVALWLWHGLAVTVLSALVVGLAIASHDVWEHTVAWLLHADKARVHAAYAGPGEVPVAWNAVISLLLAMTGVAAVASYREIRRIRRVRAEHRLLPMGTANSPTDPTVDIDMGAVSLVPEPTPLIYCLPGRPTAGRIVVTTGACELLTERQLAAALDHERAHLARGHHVMVLVAEVVATTLRWLRLLQHYPGAVRLLVELDADDHAAQRHGSHVVATALLEISCADSTDRHVGLSMSGTATPFRIRRLMVKSDSSPRRALVAALMATAVLVSVAPVGVAVLPSLSLVGSVHWPTDNSPATHEGGEDFVHHP